MSRRQTFEIPGVTHGGAPIPMAVRVGNSFQTSAVMGKDPATNTLPEDGAAQVGFVFQNLGSLLDVANVGKDEVTFVEVLLSDDSLRSEVNKYWLEWFPNEDDRPARHTTNRPLPGGMVIQLRVQACSDGQS